MPIEIHLWVLAYDDYPMDSIRGNKSGFHAAIEKGNWFTFYHDGHYRALKWDQQGNIIDEVKRQRPESTE